MTKMAQELVSMVEADLRQVVEAEFMKFRDRHPECTKVDSIYLNEDVSIGVYDIQLHGLICNHYLNLFVTRDIIHEFPEFGCRIVFEDKEANFRRDLGYIMILYTPLNRCYIKAEIHEYELREAAEYIVKTAAAIEAAEEEGSK